MRAEPSDKSEMVNQILFGESFTILEVQKNWTRVQLAHDHYEGWIDTKQYQTISNELFEVLQKKEKKRSKDLLEFVSNKNELINIPMGADVTFLSYQKPTENAWVFEGSTTSGKKEKQQLLPTAFLYLNTPYLWGGKSPFGIDCSGFTQMVYALNGYEIPRDAKDQAMIGETLSFIEECEAGDLAFFDNEEGVIIHTGIVMPDNYIIHAHGKVRIDRLDHLGILNVDTGLHTHKLRVLKKII